MTIRLLPQNLINQIAAGEVVERPAAALKELVENAIDAGADQITVRAENGGKTFLKVQDNGKGMTPLELKTCVLRHATSKLPTNDLCHISFLGFRGEALPSIGSVARLSISSRPKGASEGWQITVEGGEMGDLTPTAHPEGTSVEVRDLFYVTPARLKFLKSDVTEQNCLKETLCRLAMAYPNISFRLETGQKTLLSFPKAASLLDRVHDVIGKSFRDNALDVNAANGEILLKGFVGLPTYTRSTSQDQYLFVNGRFVRDKVLLGAVRGAFQGLIGHDVFPVLALFLTVPPEEVDVNVHPAKTEVRFKDTALIRGFLVSSLRHVLADGGFKTASVIALGAYQKAQSSLSPSFQAARKNPPRTLFFQEPMMVPMLETPEEEEGFEMFNKVYQSIKDDQARAYSLKTEQTPVTPPVEAEDDFPPLGFAKAQLHKTYIVAQAKDGIVIVDQHAAHERLTYEKLAAHLAKGKIPSQMLLIPEVVQDLTEEETGILASRRDELEKEFSLVLDAFGERSVVVREIPAFLDKENIRQLIVDLVATLKEFDDTVFLKDKLKDVCARMACHSSIRAGREMTLTEMNALLRQMEVCPTAGQCIHGRPTYVELKLSDVERLFGRSK